MAFDRNLLTHRQAKTNEIKEHVFMSESVLPMFSSRSFIVSGLTFRSLTNIDAFTEELWQNLDENNKISLFVRYTDIATGKFQQKIINKHQ